MGCTLVEDGNPAHDGGAVDDKALIAGRTSVGLVGISPENWRESRFDNPSGRYLNFETTHKDEHIQNSFALVDMGITKVELATAHKRCEIASAEPLGRTLPVKSSKKHCRVNEFAGIDHLIRQPFAPVKIVPLESVPKIWRRWR